MEKDDFSKRLKALEDQVKGSRRSGSPGGLGARDKFTQGSLAWRMVTELVAGMILGLGIGYGLDSLFGTMPWFLVVFAMLGFAAGIRTMMRTADEVRLKRAEGARLDGGDDPETENAAGKTNAEGPSGPEKN